MDRDFLLQITNELYRLTLLFPKKEPLRYKMRELADEILAGLVSINTSALKNVPQKLEVLHSFFEVAQSQNWVKAEEMLKAQQGYIKLKESLEKEKPTKETSAPKKEKNENIDGEIRPFSMNEREQKILAVLKEQGRAQVWEIKEIFPDVSKRTLRRDFKNLLKQGMIVRMGERNETFYQLS